MLTERGKPFLHIVAAMAWLMTGFATAQAADDEPIAATLVQAAGKKVYEIKPGKLEVVVDAPGMLESSQTSNLYCAVEGQSTIISLVPEGQAVKKGDLVCELDSAALRDRLINQEIAERRAGAAYLNARLAREVAEIAVTEYVEGVSKLEVRALEGQIAGAELAIRKAADRLERTRRAREQMKDAARGAAGKAVTSPADILAELDIVDRLEAVEQTLQAERRSLDLSRSRLDVLEKYTRERTTKALRIEAERTRTEEATRKELWMLEKRRAEKLRRQIAACKVFTPGDGVVVYDQDLARPGGDGQPRVEAGASVRERQKIASVVDLNAPLQVNVKVTESKVDRIAKGQRARIMVDALSATPLSGSVVAVSVLPDPMAMAAWAQKVYTTRVSMEGALPGLRPDQSARVEIVTDELANVRSIPVQALVRLDGKDRVAVRKASGAFVWREVVLGQSNSQFAEIMQGLEAGERVALAPVDLLTEEQKRRIPTTSPAPAGGGPVARPRGSP